MLLSAFLLLMPFAGGASGAPGDVTVSQVADIHPGSVQSNPQALIAAGGSTLLFSADDGTNGTELWRSNGGPLGPGGTAMVKNIEPGSGGSTPEELTRIGDTVFFNASDSMAGRELWKTDPPYTDAVLVEDINPTGPSSPFDLTAVGSTLFFTANDGTNGEELWKSAPPYNAASTDMVKNIVLGGGSSSPNGLTDVNGILFFDAQEPSDEELWKSVAPYDSSSTTKIDLNPTGPSFPGGLANFNGTLLFSADAGGGFGFEPYKLTSPYTTPVLVKDINPVGDSDPFLITNVNGTAFFRANDGSDPGHHGSELWKSVPPYDNASTTVLDINPGTGDSDPASLMNIAGTLFLSAGDGVHGIEPWRSNGGPVGAGTNLVDDIVSGSTGSFPAGFADVNGTAFFRAFPLAGPELFKSTGVGSTKLTSIFSTGSAPQTLTNVAGTLFFAAQDCCSSTGQELWKATIEPAPPPPPAASTPAVQAPPPVTAAPTKKKCKKKHKRAAAAKKCKKRK